jgi:hypothetical protein
LPNDEEEYTAVYERLSLLTGVPVTNTVEQQDRIAEANPELVQTYSRLAEIYGVSVEETLDNANMLMW